MKQAMLASVAPAKVKEVIGEQKRAAESETIGGTIYVD